MPTLRILPNGSATRRWISEQPVFAACGVSTRPSQTAVSPQVVDLRKTPSIDGGDTRSDDATRTGFSFLCRKLSSKGCLTRRDAKR